VVIALSMFVLIAIIGLAVDGGAMFVNRRSAQNSADAAAAAATRVMLRHYEEMILNNPDYDVDGTAAQESEISQTLTLYAAQHGIPRSHLQAYYVNDTKQIVADQQVGYYNGIPWSRGAKGIAVRNRAVSDSFFMRLFGWDTVGATAQAIGFMGITTESSDIAIMPLGLYSTTFDIYNLQFGQLYTLIEANVNQGNGNWGWVDFNDSGDAASSTRAWLVCGFNPSVSINLWPTWCPDYDTAPGWGPAAHYESAHTETYDPAENLTYVPFLVYGYQSEGWWLKGSSGAVTANCQDFEQSVRSYGGTGVDLAFPIFDTVLPDEQSDSLFHLRAVVSFHLEDSPGGRNDVDCTPGPPPCPGCPRPPHWLIQGIATNFYESGSTGRHGDLRHTSGHVVFLDN
jgi:Tfp pilus assembly protein PilX